MDTEQPAADGHGKVDRDLVYLGRVTIKGKSGLGYAWLDPESGQEMTFSKLIGSAIGAYYTCRVGIEEATGKILSAWPPATWTDRRLPDSERIAVHEARDESVRRQKARSLAEKRQASSWVLDLAMASLLRIAAECRSYEELESLTSTVGARLHKAWVDARVSKRGKGR